MPDKSELSTITPSSVSPQSSPTRTNATKSPTPKTLEIDESNVAPLHFHAMRIPARLQGMPQHPPPHSPSSTSSASSSISSTIHIASGKQTVILPQPATTSSTSSSSRRRRSRSRSRSRPSSRSTSRDPSPSSIGMSSLGGAGAMGTTTPSGIGDAGSMESPSIIVDADILLDRLGIEELECPGIVDNGNNGPTTGGVASSERGSGLGGTISSTGGTSLPSVNERMSEESMDDCHAFTDLKNVIRQSGLGSSTSNGMGASNIGSGVEPSKSRDGSVTGGSIMGDASCLLETLEEFEEEGSSDGDEQETDKVGIEFDKADEL